MGRLSELWAIFLEERRYRGCSQRTIEWYAEMLRVLEKEGVTTTEDFTKARIMAIAEGWRKRGLRLATLQIRDRGLRAFANWAYREGYLAENPLATLPKPKGHIEQPTPFSPEQIAAILNAAKRGACPKRDYALVLLLLDTGIRAGELRALELRSVDWRGHLIHVPRGKTGPRPVPFGEKTARALRVYIEQERRAAYPGEPALFLSRSGTPLTRDGISTVVGTILIRARIRERGLVHRFRHTAAVLMLRNGVDAFTLQRILGHSTPIMTSRYLKLTGEDLVRVHRHAGPVDRLFDREKRFE